MEAAAGRDHPRRPVNKRSAVAGISHGRSVPASAPCAPGASLPALACGEQHSRAQRSVSTSAGKREAARGAAFIVGELDDRNAIVFAKGKKN